MARIINPRQQRKCQVILKTTPTSLWNVSLAGVCLRIVFVHFSFAN